MVKTWKEAEERIRKAMEPPVQGDQRFSQNIQGIRNNARQLKAAPVRKQLPRAR